MARQVPLASRGVMLRTLLCLLVFGLGLGASASGATTWIVNSTADTNTGSNNSGTLRWAIGKAADGDTINFAASLAGPIQLSTPLPAIAASITIDGTGVVDVNGKPITVSGGSSTTVGTIFTIDSGATVSISGLTISNGNAGSNDTGGGGILNNGKLTVTGCTIASNSAAMSLKNQGGGIFNAGTLNLYSSTVSDNKASDGAGIFNDGGTVTIVNSTFSGNTATTNGGGIYNSATGTLSLTNSTISNNNATTGGGGIYNASGGKLTITNSIVAGNTASANDDVDGTDTDDGGNTINPTTPINLAPLANNGGPTETLLPRPGSPAICAGDPSKVPSGVTSDQRGFKIGQSESTYCGTGKIDSGAVQTFYTAPQFAKTEYIGQINAAVSFPAPPTVFIIENKLSQDGVVINPTGVQTPPVALTFEGSGTASGVNQEETSGASGAGTGAIFSAIQVNEVDSSDSLNATLTIGTTKLTATPATLNIVTMTPAAGPLPDATQGANYSVTFTASGGLTYTYAVTKGSVPPGMVPTTTGELSGKPTAQGNFAFTITATASNGFFFSQAYTLKVNAPVTATPAKPLTYVYTLTVNQAATPFVPVAGSGGTLPYIYSIPSSSPSLPQGLTLGQSTGAISGTPIAASSQTKYTVTVTDANQSSASAMFNLIVNPAATKTTVASSLNPSNVNDPVTFTAKVTLSDGTLPSSTDAPFSNAGTVTFNDGSTNLACDPKLSQPWTPGTGTATCVIASLSGGSHSISATYANDPNYSTSTGNLTPPQVVKPIASTIVVTLSSGSNPSTVDDSLTFTATVSPSNAAVQLTGHVSFADGTNTISGCGAVNVDKTTGKASCTTLSLIAGSPHVIVATYNSDNSDVSYTTSNSSVNQTVKAAATETAVTSAPNPSTVDQTVTFTAKVTLSAGNLPPTGGLPFSGAATVTFKDGTAIIDCGSTYSWKPSTGVAMCTTASLDAAHSPHQITAVYANDPNYSTSTGTLTPTQTVNMAATNTTVMSSANPSTVNQQVIFTATVTPFAGGVQLTGNVAFKADSKPIAGCTAVKVTAATGQAMCSISSLLQGTHTIVATYNGDNSDPNFKQSSGNLTSPQAVNAAGTETAVTSSANPSTVDQPVTFTATVTLSNGNLPPANGVPFSSAGTVTFKDGSTILTCGSTSQAWTPSTGIATCVINTLDAQHSPHRISATYANDPNYSISMPNLPTLQAVKAAGTETAVTSSSTGNISTVNQTVTFTAKVTLSNGNLPPANGVPFSSAGTVTFKDGSTILTCGSTSQAWTPSTRIATCVINTLDAQHSPHSISATYANDPNYSTSNGSLPTQTVTQAASTTSVISSLNPSVVNQAVTFQATVSPSNATIGLTGTVTFYDGSAALACNSPTWNAKTGIATCTVSNLTTVAHAISATYSGDSNYSNSKGTPPTQTVTAAPSTTSVISSLSPSVVNQPVTFTATVSPSNATVGLTGTVIFYDGSTPLACTSPTWSAKTGTATCTVLKLTAAAHTISATYVNDSNYSNSTGKLPTQTVARANTVVVITSTVPGAAINNQPVTYTASVTPIGQPVALTGTVAFADNNNVITGCSSVNLDSTTGTATCKTSTPAVDSATHSITATYSNDANYNGSTSSALNVAAMLTLTSGQNSTATVNFSLPSMIAAQTLQCVAFIAPNLNTSVLLDDSPNPIGCVLSPGMAKPGTTTTVSVAIKTGNTTTSAIIGGSNLVVAGLLGVPLFALFGISKRKEPLGKTLIRFLGIMTIAVVAAQGIGCGGHFTPPTSVTGGVTPPGVYYLQVQPVQQGLPYYAVVPVTVTR